MSFKVFIEKNEPRFLSQLSIHLEMNDSSQLQIVEHLSSADAAFRWVIFGSGMTHECDQLTELVWGTQFVQNDTFEKWSQGENKKLVSMFLIDFCLVRLIKQKIQRFHFFRKRINRASL